jgi:hypothetical protein
VVAPAPDVAEIPDMAPVEGFPQPEPGAAILDPAFTDPNLPGPTFEQGLVERIEENPELATAVNENPDLATALEQNPTQIDQIEQDMGLTQPSGVPEPAGATDQGFTDPSLTEPPPPEPPPTDQDLDDTPGL